MPLSKIADPVKSASRVATNRLSLAVLALILLASLGTASYVWIDGMDTLDAFYMTVITLSTVGYGGVALDEDDRGRGLAQILEDCLRKLAEATDGDMVSKAFANTLMSFIVGSGRQTSGGC